LPTLHLVCGLPGSGKSTFAERLARAERALWLSPDLWMSRIVGDGYDEAKRAAVEAVQWELAERVLALDVDVILDNGFWSRAERDACRARAAALGAATRLYYMDVSLAELHVRLAARNRALPPDSFTVEAEALDRWSLLFEAPADDERD
jgi:predicted kinase